jgi:hypothetical protein
VVECLLSKQVILSSNPVPRKKKTKTDLDKSLLSAICLTQPESDDSRGGSNAVEGKEEKKKLQVKGDVQ